MQTIQVKDKTFSLFISEEKILKEVKRVAMQINKAFGLNVDLMGRPVIIVEDIVDTGLTMAHMLEELKKQNPASIDICSLLLKPGKLQVDLDIKYCCLQIPNDFIVGYGLDYDGFGRNTRDIYTLVTK